MDSTQFFIKMESSDSITICFSYTLKKLPLTILASLQVQQIFWKLALINNFSFFLPEAFFAFITVITIQLALAFKIHYQSIKMLLRWDSCQVEGKELSLRLMDNTCSSISQSQVIQRSPINHNHIIRLPIRLPIFVWTEVHKVYTEFQKKVKQ